MPFSSWCIEAVHFFPSHYVENLPLCVNTTLSSLPEQLFNVHQASDHWDLIFLSDPSVLAILFFCRLKNPLVPGTFSSWPSHGPD